MRKRLPDYFYFILQIINQFCDENSGEMIAFMERITRHSSSVHAIKRYCRRFKGKLARMIGYNNECGQIL